MSAPLQPTDTSDLRPTLARHWAARVRKSATDPWLPIRGIQSLNPTVSKSRQDAGDYHSGNFTAQVATEGSWALEISVGRKLDAAGAPDPGVELLRSVDGELGSDELVEVQWWRTDGLPDSYQGIAGVDFSSAGGEKASLQGATITLTGFGSRNAVAKPTQPETATSISINPTIVTLEAGETVQLTVKDNNNADRTSDAEFESDTPASATVSSSGVVTAVATGTAEITATLGALTDSSDVTVVA